MKKINFFRLLAGVALTLALSVSINSSSDAKQWNGAGSYSGMYVFGDSLSDDGNFFADTGQPQEPYFQGRVSNGFVWVEYLAWGLRLRQRSVENYAYAGATTGRDNENDIPGFAEFPGLQDQIDEFTAKLNGRRADKRALFVVWAGANDFFVATGSPEETIATGVTNTVIAVQRLRSLGAKHILVVNLPDLGLTPYGRSVDPVGLSFVSAAYNFALDAALNDLESAGIETIRLDSAGILQDLAATPWRFGFTNVADAFYPALVGNPSRFLFWDSVHPTTRGHFIIALKAYGVLKRRSYGGK